MMFVGTRPEAIKLAPVIRAVEQEPGLRPIVVATGQHQEMLQQVLTLFGITPHFNLNVMRPDQSLGALTARLVQAIDSLLKETRADWCLVQGDTTTAFVAALVAFYHKIPVGHVEAGLRTGNVHAPFPEEANRRLVTPLAALHFPPTEQASANLLREGIPASAIHVTGNTVIDALLMEIERQDSTDSAEALRNNLQTLLWANWWRTPYVLITGHRRENFGAGFEEICSALSELAKRFTGHHFVYPVHLNPHVQRPVYERLGRQPNIHLIPPQGYSEFVLLMRNCRLVLTDSGGIQEEAPTLGKPVLVMRNTTERPEGLAAGTTRLVGANRESIVDGVSTLLQDAAAYTRMSKAANPYGDGRAAQRILSVLKHASAAGG